MKKTFKPQFYDLRQTVKISIGVTFDDHEKLKADANVNSKFNFPSFSQLYFPSFSQKCFTSFCFILVTCFGYL
jgi:hypothetical protein